MTLQGIVVALLVAMAAAYMVVEVGPTRWRGRAVARLGRLARHPATRPWTRWLVTRIGKALSPDIGCGGCKGH